MGRPSRKDEWEPITARVSPDSAKRLRIAAARRGVTTGVVLDEVIQAVLPPDHPPQPIWPVPPRASSSAPIKWTVSALKREMERRGIGLEELASRLSLSSRTISAWFNAGQIPDQRHSQISQVLIIR